jgi:hypothetical protein
MSLSFLTPVAALVGLLALLGLLGLVSVARRSDALCAALRLEPARRHRVAREALPLAAVALLLAAAAAQPVLSTRESREGREGVEVIAVLDVTRSMLARRSPSEPTRLDRSRALAKEVRAALPDVEFGLTSITDRVLPHLFPTLGANSFAATVDRSIGIERPPPDRRTRRATALGALSDLARLHFFSPESYRRIALVITDGETLPVDLATFRARIVNGRIATIFVQVWRGDEAIFENEDSASAAYRPDVSSIRALRRVAGAVDGALFVEGDTDEVIAEIRRLIGDGPKVSQGHELRSTALAPHLAAAAFLPLLLLLRRRNF